MRYIFLILCIFPIGSHADCMKSMRIELLKKNNIIPNALMKGREDLFFTQRDQKIESEIFSFGKTRVDVLSKKEKPYTKKFRRGLEEAVFEPQMRQSLSSIWSGINTPNTIKRWSRNLIEASIFEIYLSNQYSAISKFEKTKVVPEEFVLNALLRRIKRGGFDTRRENLEQVTVGLSNKEFGEVLKNKKLIIDLPFKKLRHGHFIHLFQVDLMIFILKTKGLDTSRVGDVYQWMGEQHTYKLKDGTEINSLIEGWYTFFDSFEKDLTRPEELNPILERYLGWR